MTESKHSMLDVADPLWFEDPAILFHRNRLQEFVPSSDLSFEGKMNASMRGVFYLALVFFFTGISGVSILAMLLIAVGISWLVVATYQDPTNEEEEKETEKKKCGSKDKKAAEHMTNMVDSTKRRRPPTITEGFEASSSSMAQPGEPESFVNGSLSSPIQLESASCTSPTSNNPFMNVMLGEYRTNPTRGRACTYRDNKKIKEDIEQQFANASVFFDVSDMYNRSQSQREYYTTPNTTIPNQQHQYAKWLYGDMAGRKRKVHSHE